MQETLDTWVQSLALEDPLEVDMATHSSVLAWRIPWTEELGGLQSIGVRKHLTGGFLCAVLDVSEIFCSLLIPEYSGIKRRGKPLLGLRDPGISFISLSIR